MSPLSAPTANPNKYDSEYPLPGGVEQYFDTLVKLLQFIRETSAKLDDLPKWMLDNYSASGEMAVNGYISSSSRLGLWSKQEDRLQLTAMGITILERATTAPDEARRLVLNIKYKDFSGYDAVLSLLLQGPKSLEAIHNHLLQALGVDWKSTNQATFRINWLRSLGYVTKTGHDYLLTEAGQRVATDLAKSTQDSDQKKWVEPPPKSDLFRQASLIADDLDRQATAGGDGREFEKATETAMAFLGFDTQLIGGPGNPDVLAVAIMGKKSYSLLIDSKSRTSGIVQQNDVNFDALKRQQKVAKADYAVVVAADFRGGNLEEFAKDNQVGLLRTSDLRQLLTAHATSVFPLDILRPLFQEGGSLDEGKFSEVLASGENRLDAMRLASRVYEAIRQHQGKEGLVDANSLFYILGSEFSLADIKETIAFLTSNLIGAVQLEGGNLCTRISPKTLHRTLLQLSENLVLTDQSKT